MTKKHEMKSAEELLREESGDIRNFRRHEFYIVSTIAVCWAIFQLSLASFLTLDSTFERTIHLAFAMALLFMVCPLIKHPTPKIKFLSTLDGVPWMDYVLSVTGALAALYLAIDYEGIAGRMGAPLTRDIVVGFILVFLLLEATRRIIGPALSVIAIVFSLYAFFAEHMPDFLAYKAVSLSKYMNQITLSTEGIYGIPLGVSSSIVFLFVLLGASLDKAGAGLFFTNLALSLLGRYKGGAAKAAVVASGATGLVSGSSIANIVTTGPFTIPLMKKIGYPPKKAAAMEVAASTDGQLMPPIMGAAAFIIAEYVNVAYIEVVIAASIPAFVSYFGLFCITHLEASKLGIEGLPPEDVPRFKETLMGGLHYMIPLSVLLFELVYLRHSPELAAFRSLMVFYVIIYYQELRNVFPKMPEITGKRTVSDIFGFIIQTLKERPALLKTALGNTIRIILAGMIQGSKNMMSVALACASAGIIVGVVSMGLGGMISGVVETLAQGNIFLLLVITAIASLIIGMGLPTTATYIVMAALTAPIIVNVGGAYGYVIPIIAAHLFCFYFGILADDTPPVGLAAYAASAIAESEPIPTGIQGFLYDIRTSCIAFMFVFNPELLLNGILNLNNINSLSAWLHTFMIFGMALIGMSAFECFAQSWCLTKNKWYDIPFFLFTAFILFHPGGLATFLDVDPSKKYYLYFVGLLTYGTVLLLQRMRMRKTAASAA